MVTRHHNSKRFAELRKLLALTAFCVAMAVGAAAGGCASYKMPEPEVLTPTPSADQQQQAASLVKGQKLQVQLPLLFGRDYAWRMSGSDWGDGVVDLQGHGNDALAAVDVYHFQAVKKGEAHLEFVYARPYEKAAKRVTLDVTVH
jgi:predicted secreted protein